MPKNTSKDSYKETNKKAYKKKYKKVTNKTYNKTYKGIIKTAIKPEIKHAIKGILKDNYGIIILMTIFLLIRIFFLITRYHLPGWDESVYIGMGKYIYSHGTIGLWESIRPINLPLLTGAFWAIGLNPVLFGEISMMIFTAASIMMTYILGKKIFDKDIALLGAIMLAASPVFFYHSGMIMTEIPSLLFILLTIYLYLEKRYFGAGICAGIATLFRFPAGLIFIIVGIGLIIDNIQKINTIKKINTLKESFKSIIIIGLRYASGFFIILLPFLISNYYRYRQYTANVYDAIFRPFILGSLHQNNIFESISTATFAGKMHNIFYYIITLIDNNVLLTLFIFGIMIILMGARNPLKKSRKISWDDMRGSWMLIIIVVIFSSYLTYIINKQERFIIVILPMIAIFSAVAIITVLRYIRNNVWIKNSDIRKYISIILIILILLMTYKYASVAAMKYYTWQAPIDEPPRIVEEYYMYFSNTGTDGAVLTTDPVFVSYSDKKFIPYYDTASNIRYVNPWEMNEPVAAIVYTNYSIPCISGDEICAEKRQELLSYWMRSKPIGYNYTNDYAERYIFLN